MALPRAGRRHAGAPSSAASPAPVGETGRRIQFDYPDSGPQDQRRCAAGSVPLSRCGELEPSDADIIGALHRALGSIIESTRAHEGGLVLRDPSGRELIFALVRGDDSTDRLLRQRPSAARGAARRWGSHARAFDGDNAGEDERVPSVVDIVTGLRDRYCIAAPLLDGHELLGSVEVFKRKNGDRFTPDDHNNLTALVHLLPPILMTLRDRQAEKSA